MIKTGVILGCVVTASFAWFVPTFSFGYNNNDSTNVDKDFLRDERKAIVIDKLHSKTYYDSQPTEKMHFFAAWDYCKKLSFNGHKDWRVFTKEEAVSLLELSRPNLSVKHAFKNVKEERYWTSTRDRFEEAWYIDFDLGRYSTQKENYKYRTICVRDNK